MSPCPRWKSSPSGPRHSKRCIAEVVAMKRRVGRRIDIVTRITQLHERRAGLEHQPATRSRDPGRLRDPPVRIAPCGGPVLRDREVEAGSSERRSLAVDVDQRESQIELLLEKSRRAELIPRVIEADDACAAAREPCGNIGSPTPDLDGAETRGHPVGDGAPIRVPLCPRPAPAWPRLHDLP